MGDQQPARSKDDRDVEAAVLAVRSKVNGVKGALSSFVGKMEQGPLTWPSVLDSFSTSVGHFSTLMKQLSAGKVMKQLSTEKVSHLSGRVVLPLQVCSERDTELERATEGRVSMLHHEVVPNYLRTKLPLELEARQARRVEEAQATGQSPKEEIALHNSIISSCLKIVSDAHDDIEDQKSRSGAFQSTTSAETRRLVAAYLTGSGLPPLSSGRRALLMGNVRAGKQQPSSGGKMPSAVKVEAKEGMVSASAPYNTLKRRTQ